MKEFVRKRHLVNFSGGYFSRMFYFGEVINFLHTNARISYTQSEKLKIVFVCNCMHRTVDLADGICSKTKSDGCGAI